MYDPNEPTPDAIAAELRGLQDSVKAGDDSTDWSFDFIRSGTRGWMFAVLKQALEYIDVTVPAYDSGDRARRLALIEFLFGYAPGKLLSFKYLSNAAGEAFCAWAYPLGTTHRSSAILRDEAAEAIRYAWEMICKCSSVAPAHPATEAGCTPSGRRPRSPLSTRQALDLYAPGPDGLPRRCTKP